jgi:hypothetical protein
MRSPAALLLLAALAAPATADTVYLVNGNRFEEVIAEHEGGDVRIRLPYGEIVLPGKVVERVERSPSVWEEFREREARLRRASATAGDWLDLAIWAEGVDYARGSSRALLRAAEMNPQLEGLAPLMRGLGYMHDTETGEWLSEAELMERRGYRRWGDVWLPREEYLDRLRAHREAEKRRREEDREERIARAIEALAIAQLTRPAESEVESEAPVQGPLVAVFSGGYYPLVASPPGAVGQARVIVGEEQTTFEDLVGRQPGSLFPIQPRRRHLTSSD